MKLEIRKIGNSVGVIFPKQLMENLHVTVGENLYVIESANGTITLTPYDPTFEKVMDAYNEFSQNYRNALKELANETTPLATNKSHKGISGEANS